MNATTTHPMNPADTTWFSNVQEESGIRLIETELGWYVGRVNYRAGTVTGLSPMTTSQRDARTIYGACVLAAR